ncbi:probable E3 ubiquitin ligase complex SCF subunit sconB isoform X2 [Acanthaster planci]|nr:probable E3 ubiquitin ligase complex SCF subunit sconB isoform X2 [Acanthaster planci]XP_022082714.1 probable E3 ubiquitin ligase complex SCF subunit sconB isoform X2 [Acanthaster planci]
MDSCESEMTLTDLPCEFLVHVFRCLTARDLCKLASSSRLLREITNDDVLWRRLCQQKGWERYGTTRDICKEVPVNASVNARLLELWDPPTFPIDVLVTGSDWPGLVETCKWKEVYMKAKHLEENFSNERYSVDTLESWTGPKRTFYNSENLEAPEQYIYNLAGEGNCLAVGICNKTLQIWDLFSGKRRHIIHVNISSDCNALKMQDGIVVAGCLDSKIRTFSAETGAQLQFLTGHRLAVRCVFFDGETIVSVAQPNVKGDGEHTDSDVRVWNAEDGACRFIIRSDSQDTYLVHAEYKERMVACAYSNKTIQVWNACDGCCIQRLVCDVNNLLTCHLGNGVIIGTSDDFVVKIWGLVSRRCLKTFEVLFDRQEQHRVSFAFNGELLAGMLGRQLIVTNLDGEQRERFESVYPFCPDASSCFLGNELLTVCDGKWWFRYRLWAIGQEESGAEDFSEVDSNSSEPMDYYFGGSDFSGWSPFWMSDTKVVCEDLDETDRSQIVVRHYW